MLAAAPGRRRTPLRHPVRVAALVLALSFGWTHALGAHAVVFPAEAPTGAYQRYTLRVPNERDFATVAVAITFPAGVRVISFDEVPGWTLEATAGPEGEYGAARWTGTLPVGRFVELGFIGVNPGEPTALKWDVVQTYADGTEVAWTGPVESATPASITQIVAPGAPVEPSAPSGGLGTALGGAALILALISLGLSLRPAKAQ
jgi:uncharacterized protein YcnI